jgi:hypothetical protein
VVNETIWPYGLPGSYHDSSCRCPRHCGNCLEDLPQIRALRDRLIAEGHPGFTETSRLGPRERYCCTYCRNQAKRERALDRFLATQETR